MTSRRNVLFGFAGLAAVGRSVPANAVSVTRPGTAFGTIVKLSVSAESETAANLAIDAGFAEIRAVHRAADLFHAQSEIARINADGKLETASALFATLVENAEELFRLSGGAFDASVQPLWKLWSQSGGQRPDEVSLRSALARVNWRNLRERSSGYDLQDNAALTFNGLAQGYAADLVIQALQRHGVYTAQIDTGETGLLRCDEGLPIKHPRGPYALGVLQIDTGFVAVSGDYASSFSDDFLNHHIIDPRSGFSPRELASVAVVAPTGVIADGLATAFMVMGQENSLRCLEGLPEHAALFVSKAGEVEVSPGMRSLFKKLAA